MAELILDYYKGEDIYSDGDIEEVMLNSVESGLDLDNLASTDGRWPIFYHFSRLRENLLNWYPFRKEACLLEVGGGCGALTGLFCEKVSETYVVELSKKRANINFKRHLNRENLKIFVGDIKDIEIKNKFDYITLIGVLEYAGLIESEENAYESLLTKLRTMLKPGGVILIAIENRYGIRYFTGSPEEHTGGYFDGINNYPDSHIRTFNKGEMINLLNNCGLRNQRFYYPHPDYKFPIEIFTEDTLSYIKGANNLVYSFNDDRLLFFNENLVLKQMEQIGIAAEFMNSFLVESSEASFDQEKTITYAKLNTDRDLKYRIITKICKDSNNKSLRVFKTAASKQAEEHLREMHKNSEKVQSECIKMIPYHLEKDGLSMEYLETASLSNILKSCLSAKNDEEYIKLIDMLWKNLISRSFLCDNIYSKDFSNVFGSATISEKQLCICPANIDFIFENLFLQDNCLVAIDGEWIFDFAVPVKFVFWRAITIFYDSLDINVNSFLPISYFFDKYNIFNKEIDVFIKWNYYFSNDYVKYMTAMRNNIKDIYIPNLQNVLNEIKNQTMKTYLYIDLGNGYNEQDKITVKCDCNNDNKVGAFFKLPKGIKNIRWDPTEGKLCKCKILSIETDGIYQGLKSKNAWKENNEWDEFLTIDPIYELNGDFKEATYLRIYFYLEIIDLSQVQDILFQSSKQLEAALVERERLLKKIEIELADNERLTEEIRLSSQEKERLLEQIGLELADNERLTKEIKQDSQEKERLGIELKNQIAKNDNLRQILEIETYEKELILNSTSWKITRPIRMIKNVFVRGK